MDVCIILEKLQKSIDELKQHILAVEPSMEFEVFQSVQEFAEWYQNLCEEPPEEEFYLRLIVSSEDILGVKHLGLFEKISLSISEKGYLKEVSRVPLLISAYDQEEFKSIDYQSGIISNVIFKPFDELICRGKIGFALSGAEALSQQEVNKVKPVSPLEMLKRVEIDRVTELGFRSLSTKSLPVNDISRYYLPILKPLGINYGVYATCTKASPTADGRFSCNFSFFGLDSQQARQIRKLVATNHTHKLEIDSKSEDSPIGAVLILPERHKRDQVLNVLEENFSNVEVTTYQTYGEFAAATDPKKALENWLEQLDNTGPVALKFSKEIKFLKAIDLSSKQHIEEHLGLQLSDFANLPDISQKLTPAMSDSFWRGPNRTLSLILDVHGRSHYITLEKVDTLDPDTDDEHQYILLRPVTLEELHPLVESQQVKGSTQFLFVSEYYVTRELRRLLEFKQLHPETHLVGIGKTPLKLFEQAKQLQGFSEYLIEPVDSSYMAKKLLYLHRQLRPKEPLSRFCVEKPEFIKVGNQVEMKCFSEISLSFEYHRELEKDSFREFVIHIGSDNHFEEITAKHLNSETGDENTINNFAVFGNGDSTNQRIRQWLNEQYILSKKEDSSDST